MPCVKLLGQRLSARDFDRQVAESKSVLQPRKPHILALWEDALQGAQSALLQSLNRRDVPNAGLGFHLLDLYSILE